MLSVRSKTRTLAALVSGTLALGGYAGCSARHPLVEAPSPAPAAGASAASAPAAPNAAKTPPAAAAAAPHPTLLITEPQTLAALERQGLTLAGVLGAPTELTNRELAQLSSFAPVVQELEREAARAAAADKLAGVDVARFSHRLFDRRFLRLPQARFSLAGVVNRPDRAPFGAASCGETRLIYRLSYALDAERASKLPMTLGIELQVPRGADGCRQAAARWLEPAPQAASRRQQQQPAPAGCAPSKDRWPRR